MRPAAPPTTFRACVEGTVVETLLDESLTQKKFICHRQSPSSSLSSRLSLDLTHLPPVGVLLVHHMEDVSLGEGQARFFTRDQVVCGRIIVEVGLKINLQVRV